MKTYLYIYTLLWSGLALNAQEELPDSLPVFPGGNSAMFSYIGRNLNYPAEAREYGKAGRVYVRFTIDTSGKVTQTEVKRSSGMKSLDEEALRVINSMPQWEPAYYQGRKVRYSMTMPIGFSSETRRSGNQLEPDAGAMNIERANQLYDEGKFGQAIDQYRIYIKKQPSSEEPRLRLGYCYHRIGERAKACEIWSQLKSSGSSLADDYLNQYCSSRK